MTNKQIPKYRDVDGRARNIAQPSNVGNAVRYAGKSNELHTAIQQLLCHQLSLNPHAPGEPAPLTITALKEVISTPAELYSTHFAEKL